MPRRARVNQCAHHSTCLQWCQHDYIVLHMKPHIYACYLSDNRASVESHADLVRSAVSEKGEFVITKSGEKMESGLCVA